jgi:hypothetical protein
MKKLSIFLLTLLSAARLTGHDIQWSFPPTSLSTPNVNASDPQVAMDRSGNAVALWIESGTVQTAFKPLNMNWGSIQSISSSMATSAQVVSDSNGNVTAIWLENGIVKTATKNFSGSWGAPVVLSNAGAASPTLAVDPNGNVIAAWARHGNIESSLKKFNNPWSSLQTINSSNAAFPSIAFGSLGSNVMAVVAWHGSNGGVNSVFASTRTLTANWTPTIVLSSRSHQAGYASVAIDSNLNATAVWYSYDTTGSNVSNVTVQSSTLPSGGAWTSPAILSAPGIRDPATLLARVAYDASGNAVALWNTSFDDESYHIQAAIKPALGNWGNAYELVSGNLYSFDYDFTAASFGDAIAVYMFYNGAAFLIQSAESDITGFMQNSWSVPRNISAGANNASPELATALAGNLVNTAAVWLSSNGMTNAVLASTGTKVLVTPPSAPSVTQHTNQFGVFTEYANTLSWAASSDPTVVGYLIYRNGVFLTQVAANTLQYVDHNQVQNGSVAYGIAAVDAQNSHSVIVTATFP